MALLRLVVDTNDVTAASLTARLNLVGSGHAGDDIQKISSYIAGLAGGASIGSRIYVNSGGVQASQTGTFTGDPTAADTVTVNGVAFTARASGAVANEYNIGADVTAHAAALAASINASTSAKIKGVVTASSALGVLTLTAVIPGAVGNLFTLAESTNNFTVAGANFAGGTDGTDYTLRAGK